MSDLIQKMHQLALDVRKNSHSPYSGFKVGVYSVKKAIFMQAVTWKMPLILMAYVQKPAH